ncbi:type II toxin-antitoxin system VapB family antitoxin [Chthonobacter albigriseus]|uniref:type II toxin-antitoxin system VapB family antitoxin n=1 Tax=Chthonobacter albigriseus TaxID=1683161 RepID=UPI0015EF1E1B|nr:type II toxin-antitoxin system VapB family antitoxin [Chthonobacter albigriseus]
MPLSIRDARAATLARDLARRRGTTMTAAIVQALENELKREKEAVPLAERLSALAARAKAMSGPNPRPMSKDERDALWDDS